MKFNSITAILTAIIFTLTGEAQDPITLRLAVSVISALMLSSIYCALTEESRSTKTIALLTGALIAATIADPDPSTIQVLMAFVVAPIALSPMQIENLKLRVCALSMLGGITVALSAIALHNYGWAAIGCAVFALGVFCFD